MHLWDIFLNVPVLFLSSKNFKLIQKFINFPVKISEHVHLNGLSTVCVLSCVLKALGSEKLLSHFVQMNGFSPVWVLSCFFKLHDTEKLLSHLVHLYGFSPVWVLSCVLRA